MDESGVIILCYADDAVLMAKDDEGHKRLVQQFNQLLLNYTAEDL